MKTPSNDGGPAFPAPMFVREADGQPMCPQEFGLGGMTLRDYFAGQALAGIVINQGFSGSTREFTAEASYLQQGVGSVATGSERLWQALQLKADMFDYLCWLDGMHGPESLHGVDRLCMASDGTTCWGKSYADAVRVAMEHDKEIFDAMEAASPNNLLGRSADDKK
jgi:hypothetical protein